jgi:hypothetical protein
MNDTLQSYLDNKYPSSSDKEKLIKISISEINQERSEQGTTDLLAGGELDLRNYPNIEQIIIDNKLLQTSVTKIDTQGLIHLKEISWAESPSQHQESEADKQLYQDLGISEEPIKKDLIKEIRRLVPIFAAQRLNDKTINLFLATEQSPQAKLAEKNSYSEKNDEGIDIFLQLTRNNQEGDFSPYLILLSLAQELTTLEFNNLAEDPFFWQYLWGENGTLTWLKDNLIANYQTEWELLLNPTTFDWELLDWEFWHLYFPNPRIDSETLTLSTTINQSLIAEFWPSFRKELIESVNREYQKDSSEDKQAQLAFKATLNYNPSSQEYNITVNYHPSSPYLKVLEKLILINPLQLEITQLKQQQTALPSIASFARLTKQKQKLEHCLQDLVDEENYRVITNKIANI